MEGTETEETHDKIAQYEGEYEYKGNLEIWWAVQSKVINRRQFITLI